MTYFGHVRPLSSDTRKIAFMPFGASPFQPIHVDVGASQRPSRSSTIAWQTSNDGPTSGGSTFVGPSHVRPRSWLRSSDQVHVDVAEGRAG